MMFIRPKAKRFVHKAYTLVNKIVSHVGIVNNSDTDEHVYGNWTTK